MRACRKSEGVTAGNLLSRALLASMLLLPVPAPAVATQGITIRYVTGTMIEDMYMLNASIDFRFGAETEKALAHGVALQFYTRVKIKKQRNWMWDEPVTAVLLKYRLQYHPLSGYYLVTNMDNGEREQFRNLDNATAYMGKLKNYPLIPGNALHDGSGAYYGQMQVKLDVQSLPAPLRPLAYLSAQWRLSSPAYVWDISL